MATTKKHVINFSMFKYNWNACHNSLNIQIEVVKFSQIRYLQKYNNYNTLLAHLRNKIVEMYLVVMREIIKFQKLAEPEYEKLHKRIYIWPKQWIIRTKKIYQNNVKIFNLINES